MTLEIQPAEPATVALADITRDPELACRAAGVNKSTAAEYAEAMEAGAVFPPIVVFVDPKGAQWLADGFHRCAAAKIAGLAEVAADVRQGTRKDALLYAASANAAHGLRRTNADKRRAVLLVLGNFPKWSDRKIGEACGVDHKTVAAARASVVEKLEAGEIPQGDDETSEPVHDLDRTVAKLSKSLDRVFAAWPAERRAALRERLLAASPSPSRPRRFAPRVPPGKKYLD